MKPSPAIGQFERGSKERRAAVRQTLEQTEQSTSYVRQSLMRRSGKPAMMTRRLDAAAPPSLYNIAVNRMGYGEIQGQRNDWLALGGDEDTRFDNYVDQQLQPNSIVDTEYDNKLASSGFVTLDKSLSTLWYDHHLGGGGWSNRMRPVREIERDTFMRAYHSKRQLQQMMVEFWLDHFNIYGWDYWTAPVWPHLVKIVRNNAFNNFYTLLRRITQHPSMLYYLDNYANTLAGPNENHARELIELHTLGAENYFGVGDPSAVPLDGNGVPVAYVDNDVYEATRALTGWSVANGSGGRPDNGQFYYEDADHDRFQKIILGVTMPANRQQQDGEDLLRILADHPGTGRYIARKLCRRFIADDPPQAVIDAAATTFNSLAYDNNQIRETLRVILKSNEFKTTWNQKVKRPFDIVVSALRATRTSWQFHWDADDSDSFFWSYDRAGHSLFTWPSPDGYPDTRTKWQSTTARVMTWRHLLWMSDERNSGGSYRWDVEARTTGDSANQIVDYWIQRIHRRQLDPADRQELVDFMAQGINPDLSLRPFSSSTSDRLRSVVALICNCPNFLER